MKCPLLTYSGPPVVGDRKDVTHLELTENIYKNAAVEHWLTIDGGDEVGDLLELQASKFFHYFRRTLP